MDEGTRIPALVEYLAQIPEYRQARGKRHPLLPLLLLVCVAMLSGARGQSAIADWGANYGRRWLRRLGFTRDVGPSQPTLSRLFQQVPHATVEAVLGRWAEQVVRCSPRPAAPELEGIALDGKRLRGSARQGAVAAHLLSAYSHRLRVVLGQVGVPEAGERVGPAREVALHGGRLEYRTLTACTALVGYIDWPGFQQALKLERRVVHKATGRVLRQETAYAITSCPPPRATPAALLRVWRGHWRIENQLHYVRDVTFGEDRSTVRARHAPQVMAAFRNTAISLLRLLGATNIAAACRRYAAQPALAFAAIGLPVDFE